MTDHATPDPWDSLAESLGAKPADDAQPRPASQPPQPPRRRERPAAKKPASPAGGGDWDSLAAEFGLARRDQASGESPAGRVTEVRSEERLPSGHESDHGQTRRPPRERRSVFEESAGGDSVLRPEPVEAGHGDREMGNRRDDRPAAGRGEDGEEGGEGGRRRRRRGRRGGRGRRREEDRGDAGPRNRDEPALEGDAPQDAARRDSERPRRGVARLPRPSEELSEGEAWREEIAAEFVEAVSSDAERPEAEERSGGSESDEDGERPRRRRRGRRGGRSRGRGRGKEAGQGGESPRGTASGDVDPDEEPLPASYGSRPAGEPQARPAADAAATDRSGEPSRGRGRRRRGSRRETGENRRGTSGDRREPAAGGRSGQGRERRRRDDSRSTRGRRTDFAPVAGRYDEDDEGLEFLGVEDMAREPDARPRAAAADDVIAESGLSGVLDVPSWVEAIGIVIAGNLTARSRSGRGDGGKGR